MAGRVKLISFAEGVFRPRKAQFQAEAEAIDLYDEIQVHETATLPADFVCRHENFMVDNPRGYGFWIWKPLIVLEALRASGPNDIVVYSDVGFTIQTEGRARMAEYLDITRASPFGMLSFDNTHIEYVWTKRDLALRLNVDSNPVVMATSQIAAGFFIVRPTASNIELMREWCAVAVEDNYRFSDDSPSIAPNDDRFVEHRHDASIGSLLRKKRGTTLTHYDVQPYDHAFEWRRPSLPMLATRLRE
ncbi:hypothetical protein [Methylobacterium sp. WL9]|uniref:hypothetical protein n=1 Tax=Methylobacterium sp. WL9 TaxID=2603898 RepID=UPI0011CC45DE|nr:hypothetical protein [Methylobacterium sp. WL9]TXN23974.1 hypothetical protein FV217_04725 [Methylobacterium sp. WL9]